MDEILISGNQVILRSVSEEKRTTTSDFYEALSRGIGLRTPILPEGIVFYASKEGRHLYATHETPRSVTLKVFTKEADEDEVEYLLKMPHIYFLHLFVGAAFENLYVYASSRAVEKASDELSVLPLKNLYHGGRVCLGSDLKFDLEGSLAGKIARVQAHFWGSTFNDDLDQYYRSDMPKEIAQAKRGEEEPFETWARLSKEAAFDPLKLSWKPYLQFGEAVDRILGEGGDA